MNCCVCSLAMEGLTGVTAIDCNTGAVTVRIVEPETGEGVGWVGYWHREWRESEVFEIGWAVAPERQGRGLAGAATALMIAIARAEREPRFMHAYPSVDNAPRTRSAGGLASSWPGPSTSTTRPAPPCAATTGGSIWRPVRANIRTWHKTGLSS